MTGDELASRRSVLLAATGAAGVVGATVFGGMSPATAAGGQQRAPLWEQAQRRGIVFGSSATTWQLVDPDYRRLFKREAGLLLTEDDLLWYKLKPTPGAELDFSYGDRVVGFAERQLQLVLGAHLVWDEGFGPGWTDDDLWGLTRPEAERLLYRTVRRVVRHLRGRMAGWIVANEVTDPEGQRGFRTTVPW